MFEAAYSIKRWSYSGVQLTENGNRRKSLLEKVIGTNRYRTCNYLVFEQLLSEWTFESKRQQLNCTYGLVSENDFFTANSEFKTIMPCAKERFDVGDICFAAKVDNQYAHLKWIAFNRSYVDELENVITLDPDSVYLYDGYTLSQFRGKGLTSTTLDKTFEYLRQIGINKAYSFILRYNFPILRSKAREKARCIGSIDYRRLFSKKSLKIRGTTGADKQTISRMFASDSRV